MNIENRFAGTSCVKVVINKSDTTLLFPDDTRRIVRTGEIHNAMDEIRCINKIRDIVGSDTHCIVFGATYLLSMNKTSIELFEDSIGNIFSDSHIKLVK